MAINHAVDKALIKALIIDSRSGPGLTDDQWADRMATIIETVALSLTVTVPAGIAVAVVVSTGNGETVEESTAVLT